ncbi:MAG: hypothetical protein ACR2PJ_05090 [Pseudomonadales bacterium]
MNRIFAWLLAVAGLLITYSCGFDYTTPASVDIPTAVSDSTAVDIAQLVDGSASGSAEPKDQADSSDGESNSGNVDIAALMKVQPAAKFPVRMAVARLQGSSHSTHINLVTARDIESDESLERLSNLDMVTAVAPITRLLVPKLESLKDLRIAAARLKIDLLLVYTIDTKYHVEGTPAAALSVLSLGMVPNKKVYVTATISGLLLDVQTGFVYGTAESTSKEYQRSTSWSVSEATDEARNKAERASFESFVDSFEKLWAGVLAEHTATDAGE